MNNQSLKSVWTEVTLGDIAEIVGGSTPSTKERDYWDGNIPWITPKDLSNHESVWISQGARNITQDGLNSCSARLLPALSVLFSSRAPIGYIAINTVPVTTNQGFKSLIPNDKIDFKFLYYWLLANKKSIEQSASGSTFAEVSGSVMKGLSIRFPASKTEQCNITDVLWSLECKIELLRAQNKTLEEMAQRLFKEWFVDFNFPGSGERPYKASGGKMVASEQGEIPEGWKLQLIGEMLDLSYGKALKAEVRTGSGYPVYGSNGPVGLHESYLVSGPGIIVGRKGTMGSVIWCDNNFSPIDTAFFVRDKYDLSGLYYYYFLLKQQDLTRLGSDSAVPGLNRQAVHQTQIAAPPKELIESFNRIVKPLFEKRRNNLSQINELMNLRDNLLPRLMCGDLTVKTS